MSELSMLIQNLEDTNAAIAHLERECVNRPNDKLLRINAQAVHRRRSDLSRRVEHFLHHQQYELVRYKIERDWSGAYPAKAVAAAIATFQDLFTSVFDAVCTQPKKKFRPSVDNTNLSTFEFAGAGAGSVVVSLAIPNDRLLAMETEVERAFDYVEKVISARTAEDLNALVAKIGVASITKVYAWAEVSVNYGIDSKISWGRKYDNLRDVQVTRAEAETIKHIIEGRSDEEVSEVRLDGILHGFDRDTSYFHLETVGDRRHVKGTLADDVPRSFTTGLLYKARVLKSVTLKYATGEEKEGWTLLALEAFQSENSA